MHVKEMCAVIYFAYANIYYLTKVAIISLFKKCCDFRSKQMCSQLWIHFVTEMMQLNNSVVQLR